MYRSQVPGQSLPIISSPFNVLLIAHSLLGKVVGLQTIKTKIRVPALVSQSYCQEPGRHETQQKQRVQRGLSSNVHIPSSNSKIVLVLKRLNSMRVI